MKRRNIAKRTMAFLLSCLMAVTPVMTSFAEVEVPAEEIVEIVEAEVPEVIPEVVEAEILEDNVVSVSGDDIFTEEIAVEAVEVEEVIEEQTDEAIDTAEGGSRIDTENSLGTSAEPLAKVYWGNDKNDPYKLIISAEPLDQIEYDQSGSFDVSYSPSTPLWNSTGFNNWWTSVEIVLGCDEKPLVPLNMDNWFHGLNKVTSITGLSNMDTSLVTSMRGLFSNSYELESIDLSGLDTSRVEDMSWMFAGCSSLKSIQLAGIDTSSVQDMTSMFDDCSSVEILDLTSFDTSKMTAIESMESMFFGCAALETIFVSERFAPAKNLGLFMFFGCSSLRGGEGTEYHKDHTDASYAHIDGGLENPGYFTRKNTENEGIITDPKTGIRYIAPKNLRWYIDENGDYREAWDIEGIQSLEDLDGFRAFIIREIYDHEGRKCSGGAESLEHERAVYDFLGAENLNGGSSYSYQRNASFAGRYFDIDAYKYKVSMIYVYDPDLEIGTGSLETDWYTSYIHDCPRAGEPLGSVDPESILINGNDEISFDLLDTSENLNGYCIHINYGNYGGGSSKTIRPDLGEVKTVERERLSADQCVIVTVTAVANLNYAMSGASAAAAFKLNGNGVWERTAIPAVGTWELTYDGKWRYRYEWGEYAADVWIPYGMDFYYMDETGCMAVNTLVNYQGALYYVDKDGKRVVNATRVINGVIYTFDEDGVGFKVGTNPQYKFNGIDSSYASYTGICDCENITYYEHVFRTVNLSDDHISPELILDIEKYNEATGKYELLTDPDEAAGLKDTLSFSVSNPDVIQDTGIVYDHAELFHSHARLVFILEDIAPGKTDITVTSSEIAGSVKMHLTVTENGISDATPMLRSGRFWLPEEVDPEEITYIDFLRGDYSNRQNLICVGTADEEERVSVYQDEDRLFVTFPYDEDIWFNTDSSSMFEGFINLSTLNIRDYSLTTYVEDMSCMFKDCGNLVLFNGYFFTSNVTDYEDMFDGCDSLLAVRLGEHFTLQDALPSDMTYTTAWEGETITYQNTELPTAAGQYVTDPTAAAYIDFESEVSHIGTIPVYLEDGVFINNWELDYEAPNDWRNESTGEICYYGEVYDLNEINDIRDFSLAWKVLTPVERTETPRYIIEAIPDQAYDEGGVYPEYTVRREGKTIDPEVFYDFEEEYTDNAQPGTGKVTLYFDGQEISQTFKIAGQASGWIYDEAAEEWRYQNQDGTYACNEWKQKDGGYAYLGSEGTMLRDSLIRDTNGAIYYVGSDGLRVTDQWISVAADEASATDFDIRWMYFNSLGKAFTGCTQTIAGKTYYFDKDGLMACGFLDENYQLLSNSEKDMLRCTYYYVNDPENYFTGLYKITDAAVLAEIAAAYPQYAEAKRLCFWIRSDGSKLVNGTETIEGIDRSFDENGVCAEYNYCVLALGSSWFNYSYSSYLSEIETITIQREAYEGEYKCKWAADEGGKGRISAYILNDEKTLILSANGAESIKAQAYSASMFSGFSSLKEIKGFELLDTRDVTDVSGLFNGCYSLKEIDLGSADFSKLVYDTEIFDGSEYDICKIKAPKNVNVRIPLPAVPAGKWMCNGKAVTELPQGLTKSEDIVLDYSDCFKVTLNYGGVTLDGETKHTYYVNKTYGNYGDLYIDREKLFDPYSVNSQNNKVPVYWKDDEGNQEWYYGSISRSIYENTEFTIIWTENYSDLVIDFDDRLFSGNDKYVYYVANGRWFNDLSYQTPYKGCVDDSGQWIFTGRYKEVNGNYLTDIGYEVHEDRTLVAEWVENKEWKVTFDPRNGENPTVISKSTGSYFGTSEYGENPQKANDEFMGWYCDEKQFTGEYVFSDLLITARWRSDYVTIYPVIAPYSSWFDTSVCPVSRSEITSISIQSVPYTETGYISTWAADTDRRGLINAYVLNDGKSLIIAGSGADKIKASEDSMEFFEDFENLKEIRGLENLLMSDVHTVRYMFYDITRMSSLDLSSWDLTSVSDGYGMFPSWSWSPTAFTSIKTPVNVHCDIELPNAGDARWVYNGEVYTKLPKDLSESVELTLDTSDCYKITLDYNGGKFGEETAKTLYVSKNAASVWFSLPDMFALNELEEHTGKLPSHWEDEAGNKVFDYEQSYFGAPRVYSDKTYKLIWTDDFDTLTFNYNGYEINGQAGAVYYVRKGQSFWNWPSVSNSEMESRYGKIATRWVGTSGNAYFIDTYSSYAPAGDETFTLETVDEGTEFTVTINPANGTAPYTVKAAAGEYISLDEPEKDGDQFQGWMINGENCYGGFYAYGNVTVIARWYSDDFYKLTYELGDGIIDGSNRIVRWSRKEYSTRCLSEFLWQECQQPNPANGKMIVGVYSENGTRYGLNDECPFTKDETFTVIWSGDICHYTFNFGGVTIYSAEGFEVYCEKGTEELSGYQYYENYINPETNLIASFWLDEKGNTYPLSGKSNPKYVHPDEDTVFTLQWSPYCTIIYDANDGSGTTHIQNAPLNTEIRTLGNTTLTSEGKTLTAWNTERDGSGTQYAYDTYTVFTESLTLYAQWAEIKHAKNLRLELADDGQLCVSFDYTDDLAAAETVYVMVSGPGINGEGDAYTYSYRVKDLKVSNGRGIIADRVRPLGMLTDSGDSVTINVVYGASGCNTQQFRNGPSVNYRYTKTGDRLDEVKNLTYEGNGKIIFDKVDGAIGYYGMIRKVDAGTGNGSFMYFLDLTANEHTMREAYLEQFQPGDLAEIRIRAVANLHEASNSPFTTFYVDYNKAVYEEGRKYFEAEDNYKYINFNGVPVINSWKETNGQLYYYGDDGWMCRDGIFAINGDKYAFDHDGRKLVRQWFTFSEGTETRRLWLTDQGPALRSKLTRIDGKQYYFGEDGFMLYGYADENYERIDNVSAPVLFCMYYFGDINDGARHVGWHVLTDAAEIAAVRAECPEYNTLSELKFLFDENGRKVTDTTMTIGGFDYVFDENGVERTGHSLANVITDSATGLQYLVPENVTWYVDNDGSLTESFEVNTTVSTSDYKVFFFRNAYNQTGTVCEGSLQDDDLNRFKENDHQYVDRRSAGHEHFGREACEYSVSVLCVYDPSGVYNRSDLNMDYAGTFRAACPGNGSELQAIDGSSVEIDNDTCQIVFTGLTNRAYVHSYMISLSCGSGMSLTVSEDTENCYKTPVSGGICQKLADTDITEVTVTITVLADLYKALDSPKVSTYWIRDDEGKWVRAAQPQSGSWIQDPDTGKWQFREADGTIVRNAWKRDGNHEYYLGPDGWMLTESFVEYDGNTYYVGENGAKVKDTVLTIDGYVCTFDPYGVLISKEPAGTGPVTDPETGITYITPQNLRWFIGEDGLLYESFVLPKVADIGEYYVYSTKKTYDQAGRAVSSSENERRYRNGEVYPEFCRVDEQQMRVFNNSACAYSVDMVFVYDPSGTTVSRDDIKEEWYAHYQYDCPRKGSAVNPAANIRITAENEVMFTAAGTEDVYGYLVSMKGGREVLLSQGTENTTYTTTALSDVLSKADSAEIFVYSLARLDQAMSSLAYESVSRDANGNWPGEMEVADAFVWLTANREKVSWQQGRQFTVDIHVKDESGHAGGTFDVIWPADTFQLVGYEDQGYFGETESGELTIFTGPIPAENGECVICYSDVTRKENTKGEGIIGTLIFEVVEGVTESGNRTIRFEEVSLHECVDNVTETVENFEGTTVNVGKIAYGDIYTEDGDGVINTSDAAALERYLVHWDGYDYVKDMPEADINDDGYITSADVAILMRKITKWPEYEKYFE